MTPYEPDQDDDDDSRRGPLLALMVVAVLAVIGLALVFYLRREGAIEDCLLAGGRNCDRMIDGR